MQQIFLFVIIGMFLGAAGCETTLAVPEKSDAPTASEAEPVKASKEKTADHESADHHGDKDDGKHDDGPRPFDETADAWADVEDTLSAIKKNGKMGLFVFGGDWCHDSRGLAGQFEKPRFQALIMGHYELLYVDVGRKNRNIDVAQHFGVEDIVGTPTVFVTNSDGEVLNLDTAPTWRDAASRSEEEIWDYFYGFANPAP